MHLPSPVRVLVWRVLCCCVLVHSKWSLGERSCLDHSVAFTHARHASAVEIVGVAFHLLDAVTYPACHIAS